MHAVDYAIIVTVIAILFLIAFSTKRYTKSVADFLAANRCGGRYLLTIAEGVAGLGAITVVANFEQFYNAGFAALWWLDMLAPIGLIIAVTGWITYRYRQTQAMTMAQFFEMRYSRNFRIFAGILAWISGLVNYGIFPAVTARFLIFLMGIPQHFVEAGPFELNLTLGLVMFVLLGMALVFTFMGGQIAIMLTDFFQGQFVNIVLITIMIFLLIKFGWCNIIDSLKQAPENSSMLNPFKQASIQDFTFGFFAIWAFRQFYGFMAWQGSQGYYCAAKTPHEARMARVLASWRQSMIYILIILMPICAYVLLNSDMFPEQVTAVKSILASIDNPQIQTQMTVPAALTEILPAGLLGLFCAAMIAAAVSTDDTYLHSWGSIFIQDVVLPLRKKPLTSEQHLKWLKISILGVAAFGWIFSMVFPLREYIHMFFQITGAIYIGGAGSVIICGLYWKRGTTLGAWLGMITGSFLAVSGIIFINIIWPALPQLKLTYSHVLWIQSLPKEFPFNGIEMMFISAVLAFTAYVIGSLLSEPDPDFDMDKMLHRGKYQEKDVQANKKNVRGLRAIQTDSKFTRGDKIIYFAAIGYTMFWFVTFVIGTVYNLRNDVSEDVWAKWWQFKLMVVGSVAFITIVWFLWGGILDVVELFKSLSVIRRNVLDDGRVVSHHNLIDEEIDIKTSDEKKYE